MHSQERPLNVVIIGGSLAGLMCGIALKEAGHVVTILEREGDERESHMAGVCLGLDAGNYLAKYDRNSTAFSQRCLRIQALKDDETIQVFVNARRDITNWDTFYYRLRSTFDGYSSSHYPKPPFPSPSDGNFTYNSRREVLEMSRPPGKTLLRLAVRDRDTHGISQVEADLVIGADGPDSFIRNKYAPNVQRQYSGYVAWRGTVPENMVSEQTRQIFRRSVTVYMMHRHHCIIYTIPGKEGSLEPGERYINFLWYTNESKEDLEDIMVDSIDQHKHHNIVPAGRVRKDIWGKQLARAREIPLAGPFLEVIDKIEKPFIQVITDFCSTQAAFEDGRVLLVGDGLSLFRPHTAFSGTQAAFHALKTAELVDGRISLRDWEKSVLRYSRLHWLQSIWYGNFYQYHPVTALMSAVHYWMYCGMDKVISWWRGEDPLLRGTSSRVESYDDE